jgi:hypothetical protein
MGRTRSGPSGSRRISGSITDIVDAAQDDERKAERDQPVAQRQQPLQHCLYFY